MKIYVCVKHVPDTAVNIIVSGDTAYDDDTVKFIINPYDEYAVEEAVRLVEENEGEVIVVTVGNESATEPIRSALAMGAARAIHIKTDTQFLDSELTARALKAAIEQDGEPDMIFTGKGAVDTEGFQTMYRLARLINMPVVNDVSALTVKDGKATAQMESGAGEKQIIQMNLPCVIGAAKGLNEPRYPKFKDVMMSKKKKIAQITLSDLGVVENGRVSLVKLEAVPERSSARMIEGTVDGQVTELVRLLKEEEKVLE